MIRQIRLLVFFVVGLALGGGAVSAFAAASSYGRSMNLNYPNGGQARAPGWYSQPRYDFPGAPDGWGHLRDINTLEIGGKRVELEGVRKFSPRTLAQVGKELAKSLGPLGLGITIAELVWDEAQGWLIEPEPIPQPEGPQGSFRNNICSTSHSTPRDACLATNVCAGSSWPGTYSWDGQVGSFVRCHRADGSQHPTAVTASVVCPTGWTYSGGACVAPGDPPERRAATDAEIEDAIYTELVARGMGSELARRLVDAGYTPTPDEVTGTGPASVPGDTITSTTSGPAGRTTTTTQTVHNISYNANTTNNTTTVTITNTTTTITTAPDGSTTTTTETETPSEGETVPPEEPKPFCELYPSASACQELGETPDEELEEESVNVMWDQEGGAAGVCPAPIAVSVLGTQHMIQWTPICQVASGIRPIVIGVAWLSAALWLFVMARARA